MKTKQVKVVSPMLMSDLARAMHVLLLTPTIRQHLKQNDPKAFEQAEAALLAEGPAVRQSYQQAVDRLVLNAHPNKVWSWNGTYTTEMSMLSHAGPGKALLDPWNAHIYPGDLLAHRRDGEITHWTRTYVPHNQMGAGEAVTITIFNT